MSHGLAIPSLFLGAPLGVGATGYLVGSYFFQSPRTGFFLGFVLGFIIAIRECIRTIRKLSKPS
ncbi:MAG: hypothetical protein SFY68_07975 [Candidatus Sumerlaeia bacterium]|nr:hypothetical protein [Candidatus Sumerlaeia bacterium]